MTMNLNFETNTSLLIGLGISIFTFSTYCFITKSIPLGFKTIYFYDSNLTNNETVNDTVTSNETIKQNLNQSQDRIDEIISLLKVEDPNIYTLSDEALKERILNILHGMCSESDSLSEVPTLTQSVFDYIREQDPGTRDFMGNINEWVNTTQYNLNTNNPLFENLDAKLEKLSLAIKEIKSTINNNINNLPNSELLTYFNVNDNFITKLYYLINSENHIIDYTTLNNIMISSSLPLIESNLDVYANLITNMLN
uniref:hypothetical protein n=1 Tax=Amanita sinensis TaxID=67728 RepID=UPI001D1197AC|nr:hypothetical protein LK379_mgp09 [Amanita sinensis]QZN08152.1 hypothetical protein [Amanita sinensis]